MASFTQERHVELVDGANERFVIISHLVLADIPTQLPHTNVFVHVVNDVDDAKQDALVRVARISDLTTIPIGRDAGIAAPSDEGVYYLSSSSTNSYDTLETATAAAVAFQDRVNALIESWIVFHDEFDAPDPTPATYTFPRGDSSQVTVLIEAYKVAKQDRYQKQLAKTEADAALTRASTDYTYKQGLTSGLSTAASAGLKNEVSLSVMSAALGSALAAGSTFLAAASGTPPSAGDKTTFQAALTNGTVAQSAAVTYATEAAALTSSVVSYQSSRSSDATTAAATLTTAQADQLTKAQQLTSALATESAALTAVLAVCPDFDKHSVPFVDDNEA